MKKEKRGILLQMKFNNLIANSAVFLREYMAGFYGSKKRRKAEYVEKKKLKQKQLFKDNRKEVKKVIRKEGLTKNIL